MPAAPRPNRKGKKIAYDILGVPMNLQKRNTRKDPRIEGRLRFEETLFIR